MHQNHYRATLLRLNRPEKSNHPESFLSSLQPEKPARFTHPAADSRWCDRKQNR
jgi:hypothetical protein